MDFKPFAAPPSEHHNFATGLSHELGVNAKDFVEGVNAYFTHVFQVLKGDVTHTVETVDDAAHAKIDELAEHVTALEHKIDQLLSVFQSFGHLQQPQGGDPNVPNSGIAPAQPVAPAVAQTAPTQGVAGSGLAAALAQAAGQTA